MPKKKTPSVLHFQNPNHPLPTLVTVNRTARRMHPNNPTQRIHPIRKDARGNYYREDQNAVRKHNEKILSERNRRSEALQREREAAKTLRRTSEANKRHAESLGVSHGKTDRVPTDRQLPGDQSVLGTGNESGLQTFSCADQDG